jgi:hypothetical protein
MEEDLDEIREELINFYLNIKIRTQEEVSIHIQYNHKFKINIGRIPNRRTFNKRNRENSKSSFIRYIRIYQINF